MVWQEYFLISLHDQGVSDPLWNIYIYSDMCGRVSLRVKVNGELSPEIEEGQGI